MDNFIDVPKKYGVLAPETEALAAFLAKPHIISSGEIDSTTSLITTSSIGDYLLSNSRWADKIAGYGLMRGTAVIRMTINAEPFHQGRVILSCLPMANRFSSDYYAMRYSSFCSQTQLPNVEIDFRDTTGELRIPYVAPVQWYNPYTVFNYDWGQLRAQMLSPFSTGTGTPNCSYTIWLSFEDMEFSLPIVPQSSLAKPRRKTDRIKRVGAQEIDQLDSKPISTALSLVSKAATTLQNVPIISSFAGPVAWATNMASQVASIFGYSKPLNANTASFFAHRGYKGMTNSEGMFQGEPLSLMADPSVQALPGFAGTDLDEMSFAYLKTIPAYLTTFDWESVDPANTLLYERSLVPATIEDIQLLTTSTGVYTAKYQAPAFHLANRFAYYRGSIRLHLKIVKTDFHSGRLSLTYTPNALSYAYVTPASNEASQYSLREIVDIRERSELVFELPYMANSNYLGTSESLGTVSIRVLNELRAPSTAASSIKILVYMSAGDDFELQCSIPTVERVITPQGLDPQTLQTAKAIANTVHNDLVPDFAATSIGEMFTSVKQMIMRYSRPCNAFVASSSRGFKSWWFNNHAASPNTTNVGHDMLSALASGYLLARGSINYMVPDAPNLNAIGTTSAYCFLTPSTSSTILAFSPFVNISGGSASYNNGPEVCFADAKGGVEVQVPYYNKTLSTLVHFGIGPNFVSIDCDPNFRLNFYNFSNDDLLLYRAAGDDFQLGYFVGFAPYFVGYTPNPV